MVLSSSQQVVVAFTVVLFAFVVLPRMFGVGTTGSKDKAFDPRYNRKGSCLARMVNEILISQHCVNLIYHFMTEV